MICLKHHRDLVWDENLNDWVCSDCMAEEFGDELIDE